MRMKQQYFIIKENLKPFKSIDIQNNSNSYIIKNWNLIYNVLINLREIDTLKQNIDNIFGMSPFFKSPTTTLELTAAQYSTFQTFYKIITENMITIISFCDSIGFEGTSNGFDIKMPVTKDFNQFSKDIQSLEFIFCQCPYLNKGDQRIELLKTDLGSIWLEFAVIGAVIGLLGNIAKLVDKAVQIKSHMITCQQQEQQLRTMKIGNDIIENIMNANKKATEELLDKFTDELANDIEPFANGEEKTKTQKSLEYLSEMMTRGMQIYSAIDSPQEIKDLFPNSDKQALLPEPKKQIADKSE